MLDQVKLSSRPTTESSNTSRLSATDWRKIRILVQLSVREVWAPETWKIINTIDHLTTQVHLLRIENKGLQQAVKAEKKRRKRGKPLFDQIRDENGCQ